MGRPTDKETLRKFVTRARRIAAHSLVQDEDKVARYARGSFDVKIRHSEKATMIRPLPSDEEVFESLAARIRPITLSTESIHYKRVLAAIRSLVGEENLKGDLSKKLENIAHRWNAAELQGKKVQEYAIQKVRADGSEGTAMVSDTQLAAAWLYADLVHADALGNKAQALAFPMSERYAAAVRLFFRLAIITVSTLRFIEYLQKNHLVDLGNDVWDEEVTVGTNQIEEELNIYIAPVETPMPDLRETLSLPEAWEPLTISNLSRIDPSNQIRITLLDGEEQPLNTYEAVIMHRSADDSTVRWQVLVENSVILRFVFIHETDQLVTGQLESLETLASNNRLTLSSSRFLLNFNAASTLLAEAQNQKLFSVGLSPSIDDQAIINHQVLVETMEDLLTIEAISGQQIDTPQDSCTGLKRIRLRQVRLLWEGHIINRGSRPMTVRADKGKPPELIVVPQTTMIFGGVDVPVPQQCIYHPRMEAIEVGRTDAEGEDETSYEVRIPEGEKFFVWAPTQKTVEREAELTISAEVNLTG